MYENSMFACFVYEYMSWTLYTIHKMKMVVPLTDEYKIITVLKVETYIFTSMAASPVMHVETFKTNVSVLYRKRHIVFDNTLTDNFIIRLSPLILTIYLCEVKGLAHKLLIKRIIATHFSVLQLETKRLKKQEEQQRMSRDTDNIGQNIQKEDKRWKRISFITRQDV